jgi:hypothetical protein
MPKQKSSKKAIGMQFAVRVLQKMKSEKPNAI